MTMRSLILTALFCAGCCAVAGQRPVGVAYYDVDRIYDTVPALFYDDSDYTPEGRLRWTSARSPRPRTSRPANPTK